jgi:hypothetical protein
MRATPLADREYLTPPAIGKMLGVSCTKIIGWIERGELRASNLATNRANRARWYVARADLDSFLAARAATPPAPRVRSRRRQRDELVTKYY